MSMMHHTGAGARNWGFRNTTELQRVRSRRRAVVVLAPLVIDLMRILGNHISISTFGTSRTDRKFRGLFLVYPAQPDLRDICLDKSLLVSWAGAPCKWGPPCDRTSWWFYTEASGACLCSRSCALSHHWRHSRRRRRNDGRWLIGRASLGCCSVSSSVHPPRLLIGNFVWQSLMWGVLVAAPDSRGALLWRILSKVFRPFSRHEWAGRGV